MCIRDRIGTGELHDELVDYVKTKKMEDCVLFPGVHSNVQDYYSAMDVFCLPSLFEGLPLTAVEAQASGLMTVLSDNISKQVEVTENVAYLSNKDVLAWSDYLNRNKNVFARIDRIHANELAARSIYNIKAVSKKIIDFYEKYRALF